jgi:hypothetical protein
MKQYCSNCKSTLNQNYFNCEYFDENMVPVYCYHGRDFDIAKKTIFDPFFRDNIIKKINNIEIKKGNNFFYKKFFNKIKNEIIDIIENS